MIKLRELTTRYSLADLIEGLAAAWQEEDIGPGEIVDGETSPEARPEGERKFVKLHKTEKHPNRTGNKADVFNAAKVKKDTSRAGREPLPGFPPDKWEVKEEANWGVDEHGRFRRLDEGSGSFYGGGGFGRKVTDSPAREPKAVHHPAPKPAATRERPSAPKAPQAKPAAPAKPKAEAPPAPVKKPSTGDGAIKPGEAKSDKVQSTSPVAPAWTQEKKTQELTPRYQHSNQSRPSDRTEVRPDKEGKLQAQPPGTPPPPKAMDKVQAAVHGKPPPPTGAATQSGPGNLYDKPSTPIPSGALAGAEKATVSAPPAPTPTTGAGLKSFKVRKEDKVAEYAAMLGRVTRGEEPEFQLDEGGPTKKHFQLAADTIKAIPDEGERMKHAYQHAEWFSKSNPRFNREKFYLAAGLKKHQHGPNEEIEEGKKVTWSDAARKKHDADRERRGKEQESWSKEKIKQKQLETIVKPIKEAASLGRGWVKKNVPLVSRPKFDEHGNVVLTKHAKANITVGKRSRKLKGGIYDPEKQKRFGEEKELDEGHPAWPKKSRHPSMREPARKTGAWSSTKYSTPADEGEAAARRDNRKRDEEREKVARRADRDRRSGKTRASARRRAEMSRKHPELSEGEGDYLRHAPATHKQKKEKTILVYPKGYKGGGKVSRIPKSQYDPKKHGLAEGQLDELKKSTLTNYIKTASASAIGAAVNKDHAKAVKRVASINKAADRLGGTYKTGKLRSVMIPGKRDTDPASGPYKIQKTKLYRGDEYEPEGEMLDETSKKKATNYMRAAIGQLRGHAGMEGHSGARATDLGASGSSRNKWASQIAGYTRKAANREKGLQRATNKLANEETLDEVITKDTPVGSVIKDFVHSDNKVFKGDSKKKRIDRALGAYYGKQRDE